MKRSFYLYIHWIHRQFCLSTILIFEQVSLLNLVGLDNGGVIVMIVIIAHNPLVVCKQG